MAVSGSTTGEPHYTQEQLEEVQRVLNSVDDYEVLGVSENAEESEIKQQYKVLALLLHPDKNKAPGAPRAFMRLHNALDALSGPDKAETPLESPNCDHTKSKARPSKNKNRGSNTTCISGGSNTTYISGLSFYGCNIDCGSTNGVNVFPGGSDPGSQTVISYKGASITIEGTLVRVHANDVYVKKGAKVHYDSQEKKCPINVHYV